MTYKEFAERRDAYFMIALPTEDDFAKYTEAFFNWANDLNVRVRSKWPELFKPRKSELFS